MTFGVAAYGLPCSCGFALRDGKPVVANPLRGADLINLAIRYELGSVEMPLSMLPDTSNETLDGLRDTMAQNNLALIVAGGIIDVETMRTLIPQAARAGASVVRATISPILEGARSTMAGGWQNHLAEIERRVVAVRPILEEYNIRLALENHQDSTSDELLALCDAGGDQVGVTFDVVNPLAVAEEPYDFARKVGSRIYNVHIKDYVIYPTPSGYRLVRCEIGKGVIDWAAMRNLLAEVAPHARQQIELAALYGRHIRMFEDQWWESFPARDIRDVLPTLRMLAQYACGPDEDWRTPWERDEPAEVVSTWEQEQFAASVAHLRGLDI
jgi:sugar phosphate isomerase/epimerase